MVDILVNRRQVQFLTKCNVEQGVLKVYHYIRVRSRSRDAGSIPSLSCSVYPTTHKISLNFNLRFRLMQLTSSFGKRYSKIPQIKLYLSKSGGRNTALFVLMICSAIFLNIFVDTLSQ
jgi:hypothetical protein